jgi:AcrR family transcriptional regulator
MRRQLTDQEIAAFRAKLVRAAEKLYANRGIEAVTMREIARVLGYSQTAAYRYFADKDEILMAMRGAALDRFCSRLEAACQPRRDARANARAVGDAYLQFALDEPHSYRLIFDTKPPDRRNDDYDRIVARFRATMTGYVRGLIDAGYVDGDPVELGLAFCVATHGVVMMHLSKFMSSIEARNRIHSTVVRLIYRGAQAQPSKLTKSGRPKSFGRG